jgi:poly(3-hydroxybutyrate) depolymerase
MRLRRLLVALGVLVAVAAFVVIAGCNLLIARYRPDRLEALSVELSASRGTYRTALEVDGRVRSYLLHLPEAVNTGAALPLVIVLHGGGSEADRMDGVMG